MKPNPFYSMCFTGDWLIPLTPLIKNLAEAEAELAKIEIKKPKSRAKYMRDYRKKPKLCPHCHKDIRA